MSSRNAASNKLTSKQEEQAQQPSTLPVRSSGRTTTLVFDPPSVPSSGRTPALVLRKKASKSTAKCTNSSSPLSRLHHSSQYSPRPVVESTAKASATIDQANHTTPQSSGWISLAPQNSKNDTTDSPETNVASRTEVPYSVSEAISTTKAQPDGSASVAPVKPKKAKKTKRAKHLFQRTKEAVDWLSGKVDNSTTLTTHKNGGEVAQSVSPTPSLPETRMTPSVKVIPVVPVLPTDLTITTPPIVPLTPTYAGVTSRGTKHDKSRIVATIRTAGNLVSTGKVEPHRASVPKKNETFVKTVDELHNFLRTLRTLNKGKIELFCDMEGNNLGKNGTISLFQVTIKQYSHTWILDITFLGKTAFDTMCDHGMSLRGVLEDKDYPTAWFDLRNDQSALFFIYGIRLKNVVDIQYLELATRTGYSRRRRAGLKACIENEAVGSGTVSPQEAREWLRVKNEGKSFFREHGYGVFDIRPMHEKALKYAGQDTIHMPMLLHVYCSRLGKVGSFSWEMALDEAKVSVEMSCSDKWIPEGEYRGQHAISPWSFYGHEDPYEDWDDYY